MISADILEGPAVANDLRKTILVIDDEEAIRESIALYLEDCGFHVRKAENGTKGIAMFDSAPADLVMVDLLMPDINGFEVMLHIKNQSPDLPLIVISGTRKIPDAVEAIRCGAWDYLVKPVEDITVLLHVVNKAFQHAALIRENREYRRQLEDTITRQQKDVEKTNVYLKEINERLQKIIATTQKLPFHKDIRKFGKSLLEEFGRHMGAEGGSLFLVETEGLHLLHSLDPGHAPSFIPLPLKEGSLFQKVIIEKQPILVENMADDDAFFTSGWKGYKAESVIAFPLYDETGDIVGVLSLHDKIDHPFAIQDVEIGAILASFGSGTLRALQASRAVSESERKYRLLADNASDVILTYDMKLQNTYISPSIQRMLGFSPDEIACMDPLKIMPQQYYHQLIAIFKEERDREKSPDADPRRSQTIEIQMFKKDGAIVWVEMSMSFIRDENHAAIGVLTIARDISERKATEFALVSSQQRLALHVDQTPLGVVEWNLDFEVTEWNPSAERIFGYTRDEALGKNVSFIVPRDGINHVSKSWLTLIARREGSNTTTPNIAKNGEIIHCEWYNTPLINAEEKVIGVASFVHDVTDRIQIEEARKSAEAQLRQSQKMEALGRLAGGVAHDLNNLLSPILGYGEMLLEDISAEEKKYHRPLQQIHHAGLMARDLVQQLLAFGRKQPLEFKTLDMNAVVRDFLKLLRKTIREDIAIELKLMDNLPYIRADLSQLRQSIMNLAVNSQDAMPQGGKLIIETGLYELDGHYAAQHEGVDPGQYVSLIISDTGHGMNGETLKKVFDPFFTTKDKDKGTGLGLATVYGIVKQHGGNVWAYSEPGIGATFKLYFPVTSEEYRERNTQSQALLKSRGGEVVMVVEDDEMVRNLVIGMLDRQGYHVLSAEDGPGCLQYLSHYIGPLHLLVTDVIMPSMNGKDLFAQVERQYPTIKVLFMSGYTDDVIACHGILEDDIEFIQKPFSIQALAEKVRQVLDG